MHRLSLASCSRATIRSNLVANAPKVFSRARTTSSRKPPSRVRQSQSVSYPASESVSYKSQVVKKLHQNAQPTEQDVEEAIKRDLKELTFREARRTKTFTEEELIEFLAQKVNDWKNQAHVKRRFVSYGIPPQQVPLLLNQFALAVRDKRVLSSLRYTQARKDRLAYDLSAQDSQGMVDEHFSRLFYEWTADPAQHARLSKYVPTTTLEAIEQLFHAVDLSNPTTGSPTVRSAPRRKVIMHVGPTNSGKTHNALRALAAAERGVYAGPLRLLAHEIFDRLNKGQILPLGVELAPNAEPDENTNLEVASGSIVVKQENEQFARACNLITGEEQRIVLEDAGLMSCTVEMASLSPPYLDVAIIDEIQLISDPERGGAWTKAVLGLNAAELHLCGEERAVPLIQELLKDTQDELIVHRYERLTPLQVADESLKGDYSKIQKGDCVVTFARSNIFKTKARIEKATGLRCAVVYGGLPPEIRSTQAAWFNSADSGYDVIVGSDAIGMGLNLKIKRMIFDAVHKWSGKSIELLELSSFKQIAGRAGRFGLHAENSPGIVTTMREADLPILRKALQLPIEPLRYARLHANIEQFSAALQALPSGTPLPIIQDTFKFVSKMHHAYEYESMVKKANEVSYIDSVAGELTLKDRLTLRNSPIGWREPDALRAAMHILQMLRDDLCVDYHRLIKITGFQEHFDDVQDLKASVAASGHTRVISDAYLQKLEMIHKTLTLYMWLSFRIPVSFPHVGEVVEKVKEVERDMQWLLEHLSKDSLEAAPGPGLMLSWQKPRPKEGTSHWENATTTYSEVEAPSGFGLKHAAAAM